MARMRPRCPLQSHPSMGATPGTAMGGAASPPSRPWPFERTCLWRWPRDTVTLTTGRAETHPSGQTPQVRPLGDSSGCFQILTGSALPKQRPAAPDTPFTAPTGGAEGHSELLRSARPVTSQSPRQLVRAAPDTVWTRWRGSSCGPSRNNGQRPEARFAVYLKVPRRQVGGACARPTQL